MNFMVYAICVLTVVDISCAQKVNEYEADKSISESIDNHDANVPDSLKPKSIEREIEGEKVKLKLDGKLDWEKKIEDVEYPLQINEVYPDIVVFDKLDTLILPYNDASENKVVISAKERIEFFNKSGKLINIYSFYEDNPYLVSNSNIKVRLHYGNAEGTGIPSEEIKANLDGPDEYHVTYHMDNYKGYSLITYQKTEVTTEGWILNTLSTIVVLDSVGNIIFENEQDGIGSVPVISDDGKYLLLAFYNKETVNSSMSNINERFQFWDIKRNKLLYSEINDDKKRSLSSPVNTSNGSYMYIGYSYPNSKYKSKKYYIFDCKKEKLYTRLMTANEMKEIRKYWYDRKYSYEQLIEDYQFNQINHTCPK
jgi:hypothetical protein